MDLPYLSRSHTFILIAVTRWLLRKRPIVVAYHSKDFTCLVYGVFFACCNKTILRWHKIFGTELHTSESLTGRVNTVDANVCPRHENLRLSDRLPKLARGLRCFCDGGYSMHWYLNDEVFPRRIGIQPSMCAFGQIAKTFRDDVSYFRFISENRWIADAKIQPSRLEMSDGVRRF